MFPHEYVKIQKAPTFDQDRKDYSGSALQPIGFTDLNVLEPIISESSRPGIADGALTIFNVEAEGIVVLLAV